MRVPRPFLTCWLLAALLAAWAPASQAAEPTGKLHVLLAIDSRDEKIGKGVALDRDNVLNLLNDGFRDHKDLLVKPVVLDGDKYTRAGIEKYFKDLRLNEGDSLLVYFSCHGYLDEISRHNLYLGPKERGLPRATVRKWMQDKKPRLALLITDACAEYLFKEEVKGPAGKPDWDTMRSLFLEGRGSLDINAAAEGELSWCNKFRGSFFTLALVNTLRKPFKELAPDGALTWQQVLPPVQVETRRLYLDLRKSGLKDLARALALLPADNPDRPALVEMQKLLKEQEDQTVRVWSLPATERFPEPPPLGITALDLKGGRAGVQVASVAAGVSGKLGLKPGDIIVAVAGEPVKNAREVDERLRKAGGPVEIRYKRPPGDLLKKATLTVPGKGTTGGS